MPLAVRKQPRESSQGLVRRFSQKMRQSGIMLEVRKRKFKKRDASKKVQKISALRRIKKTEEFEQLKKMGIL